MEPVEPSALVQVTITILMGLAFAAVVMGYAH